jgi:hypothetical protein
MRAKVLGADGWLRYQLCRLLNNRMRAFGTVQLDAKRNKLLNILFKKQHVGNMEIYNLAGVKKCAEID